MLSAQPARKYWVFFSDKGASSRSFKSSAEILENVKEYISDKALQRRAKVLPPTHLVDEADLPVADEYLSTMESIGGVVQQTSRWLNAASFFLTQQQIERGVQLSFVKNIIPVVVLHGTKEQVVLEKKNARRPFSEKDYGQSRQQLEMIGVPFLHALGITAYGIRIGMLDSGFRWKVHEALRTRNVIAEHDFVSGDGETGNEPSDPAGQDEHGTATLSVVGGYQPGKLFGPAFDAEFVLAKTEYVPVTDYRWEEDNWVAGLEWMEGLGVDVVSSSLGYNTFVDSTSYRWANGDFDGRTAVSSIAAARAAKLGVVVCDAMGNEGNGDGVQGTMLAPADADSIISVGAVNFVGRLPSFSSTGPTNDGRIKPDLVAPGVGIYHASTLSSSSYGFSQGTSMATPLVAGCAALLLSIRPELTPLQVRDILRTTAQPVDTANYPARPNNFVGWGLVNATEAAFSLGPIFSNKPLISVNGTSTSISIYVLSNSGINPARVIFHLKKPSQSSFNELTMRLDSAVQYPTSGKYIVQIPPEPIGTDLECYISVEDSAGQSYQSPPPSKGVLWQFKSGIPVIGLLPERPLFFTLFQNYPNPFNNETKIRFELRISAIIDVTVFNLLGQSIRQLYHGSANVGTTILSWDGNDEKGVPAPSGVYVCRLKSSLGLSAKKMLLLR
jgi:serine protease AprX